MLGKGCKTPKTKEMNKHFAYYSIYHDQNKTHQPDYIKK